MSLKISVLAREFSNMGDHAEYVIRAYDVQPGETVEDLVQRLLTRPGWTADAPREPSPENWIELRIIEEASK